jgi:hypothetical protein
MMRFFIAYGEIFTPSTLNVLPDANDNPVLDTVAMAEPPDCNSKFPEVSPDVMMPPGPLVEALIEAIYFS